MKSVFFFLIVFLLISLQFELIFCEFKRICYYNSQSKYRKNDASFEVEDIDPTLCTHIIYSYALIKENKLTPLEESDIEFDNGPGYYSRIMDLKEINPSLKVLLAVGGSKENAYMFDEVIKSDESINSFASSAVRFLKDHKFDGLDVEWFYPLMNSDGFIKLLEAIKLEFLETSFADNSDNITLSIAVSAEHAIIQNSYQIQAINEIVDFVNLMVFDLHKYSLNKTGFDSALYPGVNDGVAAWEKTLNVDWAVTFWLQNGLENHKLVLGVPLFGKGFELKDANNNTVGSPSKGPSENSINSNQSGNIPYFELCQLIKTGKLTENFDDKANLAYIQIRSTWIGYENPKSLMEKSIYVKKKCLGGILISSVDSDDWKGNFCNKGSYPMLSVIKSALKSADCVVPQLIEQGIALNSPVSNFSSTEIAASTTIPNSSRIIATETPVTVEKSPSMNLSSPITAITHDAVDTTLEIATTDSAPDTTTDPSTEKTTEKTTTSTDNTPTDEIMTESTQETTQNVSTTIESTLESTSIETTTTGANESTDTNDSTISTIEASTSPVITESTSISDATTEITSSTTIQNSDSSTDSAQATTSESLVTSTSGGSEITSSVSATTIPDSSATTSVSSTIPNTLPRYHCTKSEIIASPKSCQHFQVCLWGFPQPIAVMKCPENFYFDLDLLSCSNHKPYTCFLPSTTASMPTSSATETATEFSRPVAENTENSTSTVPSTTQPETALSTLPAVFTTIVTSIPERTTTQSPKTSPSSPVTTAIASIFSCPKRFGYYAHASCCKKFWQCSNSVAYLKLCPGSLVFNSKINVCDYRSSTICPQGSVKYKSVNYNKINYRTNNVKPIYTNRAQNNFHRTKNFVCPAPNGFFKVNDNCQSYWSCVNNVANLGQCPSATAFNPQKRVCDFFSIYLYCRKAYLPKSRY